MTPELLFFWGIVGWCGTPWPRRWPLPLPPPPSPWIRTAVGVVGGVVGGWLFNSAWPVSDAVSVGLAVAASGVGALLGSIVLGDLAGVVSAGPQPEPPT
jgi:hypothetical protein